MSNKTQDAQFQQLIQMLQGQISNLQNPKSNPAQDALTTSALSGYDWLKGKDYSQLPGGMFFDFKNPVEQNEQYKKLINVGQDGTFALSNGAGDARGQAQGIQSQYLSDKFARDASQNYQDNISNAAGNIRGSLAQSSAAQTGNNSQVLGAMQGLGGVIASIPRKTPGWQTLLGQGGQLGSAALASF